MSHSVYRALALLGRGQSALALVLTFGNSLLIYVRSVCVCPFQLATETTVLDGQSVPGLRRRSIRMPLRCGDVRKLQSLL